MGVVSGAVGQAATGEQVSRVRSAAVAAVTGIAVGALVYRVLRRPAPDDA